MSFLDRLTARLSGSTHNQAPTPAEPPHLLRQHFAVSTHTIDGFEVYSVAPMKFGETSASDVTHYDPHAEALGELSAADAATQAVLYILPGGFAEPIKPRNWDFIAQLAEADVRVEVPLYGLIPEFNGTHGTALLSQTYSQLVADHGARNVSIIADSAGGSLALGMFIADPTLPTPRQFILNAPWVDLDVSNAGVEKYEDKDPLLNAAQLRKQGAVWAQGLEENGTVSPGQATSHPIVSPINLAPARWSEVIAGTEVHVWCGDRDLSFPDATLLTDRLREGGIATTFHPQPGALHMFHLGKSRDGRQARKQMIELVSHPAIQSN